MEQGLEVKVSAVLRELDERREKDETMNTIQILVQMMLFNMKKDFSIFVLVWNRIFSTVPLIDLA